MEPKVIKTRYWCLRNDLKRISCYLGFFTIKLKFSMVTRPVGRDRLAWSEAATLREVVLEKMIILILKSVFF